MPQTSQNRVVDLISKRSTSNCFSVSNSHSKFLMIPSNPTNSLWCLKCGVPLYVNTEVIAFHPEGDMTVGGKLNGNPFHSCEVHNSQKCKALSGARGKVGELTKVMTKPRLGKKTTQYLSTDKMLAPVKIIVHSFWVIYCLWFFLWEPPRSVFQ